MIAPMIHRQLSRDDLACLVAEIARHDRRAGHAAQEQLERGEVDTLLDSAIALDVVLGSGGAPAPLPLTLLWYVPIRAALRARGEADIGIADYTATLPVAFAATRSTRRVARRTSGLDGWWESIEAMPAGTVAQAERAADTAALALWLAGCFPEWVMRKGNGAGMIRAYVTFTEQALALAARIMIAHVPDAGSLCARVGDRAELLREALAHVRSEYLGRSAHTAAGRLERFLARLSARAGGHRRFFDH